MLWTVVQAAFSMFAMTISMHEVLHMLAGSKPTAAHQMSAAILCDVMVSDVFVCCLLTAQLFCFLLWTTLLGADLTWLCRSMVWEVTGG